MKKSLWILLVIPALFNFGCSYAFEELGVYKNSIPGTPKIGALEFADQNISFDVVKATALSTCLECHTEGNHSMNTPEKTLAQKDKILSEIQEGAMPPRSSGYKALSDCDRQILETWMDDKVHDRISTQKVKELSACGHIEAPKAKPKTDFKTLELTFENLKREILAPKCLSCHTTETAKKTNLEDIEHINARNLLKETAAESALYQVCVPGLNKRFMPPKKSGIPALAEDELEFLKKWIESERK